MLNLREGAGTLVYYHALETVLSFLGVQGFKDIKIPFPLLRSRING